MKKYIILLLLCGIAKGQTNLFARQNFATGNPTANTFIGGVASTISTPALLATKLRISGSRISNFKVVGSDIQCRISGGGYVMPSWLNDTNLTYIIDREWFVTDVTSFKATSNFLYLYFPAIVNVTGSAIFQDKGNGFKLEMPNCISLPNSFFGNLFSTTNKKVLYVPRCTNFGTTKLNNNVFSNNMNGIIYAPISEQTSNSGGVEGDLAYAISQGATVRYVTNFDLPNPATSLASGTITTTTVQLNFTAPTGSTNAIDYYEVWLNGVDSGKTVTASGQNITGLTTATTYDIELIAVDIFYNKSVKSNKITVTTL